MSSIDPGDLPEGSDNPEDYRRFGSSDCYTALCKYAGMLVIAEFSRSKPPMTGRCPLCDGTQFNTRDGWVECDSCWEFAIDEKQYDKMTAV